MQEGDIFAGRYLLTRRLGQGGFAEVWRAEDQMAENSVIAIKIFAPERGLDENGIKVFRKEYALTVSLHHPHLLRSSHYDVDKGRPYLVMPFCESGSLSTLVVDEHAFSEEEIATLMAQLADGLNYLHRKGICHQDVKPDNVLLLEPGHYVLADFGISSKVRRTVAKSMRVEEARGYSAFTPAYAPPEKYTHQPEPPGDVFSLGITLYECLMGDVPFDDVGAALERSATLPALPDSYSEGLKSVIFKCLSVDPELRPSAQQLLTQAQGFLRNKSWPGAPSPPPRRQTVPMPEGQGALDTSIPEMILVEGGSFWMGSPKGEKRLFSGETLHQVTLSSFEIGKYEVTQALWERIMGSNPSSFKCAECPVEKVSWNDVQDFMGKLNAQTGSNYRLPTEAEWEFAAGGGLLGRDGSGYRQYLYAGGNNLDSVGWYSENSDRKTHPVGQKEPNALGLYDMSGNVWEWCADWYGAYPKGPVSNPKNARSGAGRVLRGGSWINYSKYCRIALRVSYIPDFRDRYLGFRLARTP